MATEVRFVKDEVGKRFEEVASDINTIYVKYPGHLAAHGPLRSSWYANCNGVALLGHDSATLSHYDTPDNRPEIYISELIAELSRICDIWDVTAAIVGGDAAHFRINRELLESRGIVIVGEYLDGWADGEILLYEPGAKQTKGDKDIVIVPGTREVLMYSRPVGYVKLL